MNDNPPITWKHFGLAVFLALSYLAFVLSIPMLVFVALELIMPPMELVAEYFTLCSAAFGLLVPHKWMRSLALIMVIYSSVAIVVACYDYHRHAYMPTMFAFPTGRPRTGHRPNNQRISSCLAIAAPTSPAKAAVAHICSQIYSLTGTIIRKIQPPPAGLR